MAGVSTSPHRVRSDYQKRYSFTLVLFSWFQGVFCSLSFNLFLIMVPLMFLLFVFYFWLFPVVPNDNSHTPYLFVFVHFVNLPLLAFFVS